jgi:Tol biopolymer transport system component
LFVIDATGATTRQLPFAAARFRQFKLAPDGRRLAVGVADAADTDVWVYDLESGARTRITSGGSHRGTAWTRDGQRIVYAASRGASVAIYRRAADASTPEEQLVRVRELPRTVALMPDNHTLIFDSQTDGIFQLDLADTQHLRRWLDPPSGEVDVTVSPDGEWAAYLSNQSGRPEIYVRPVSGRGVPVQVSTQTGFYPVWAHSGRELFFLDLQRNLLMAVTVSTKPTLTVSEPRRIMGSAADNLAIESFDVMPDDRHFVVKSTPRNPTGQRELSIITNWFQELNARVPVK